MERSLRGFGERWGRGIVLGALGVLVVLALTGAIDGPAGPGRCVQHTVTAGLDDFIAVGGNEVIFEFEPDNNGSVSVARVSLQTCTGEDTDACDDLQFDSDYDGTPDTNILTGTGGARGTPPMRVTGWVRVWSSTDPSGETGSPVLRVCALSS